MTHLLSITGLVALCAAWALFQQWLKRVDPDQGDYEARCARCESSSCKPRKDKDGD
ncbi:MAG: hypothetical protein U9Q71_05910 [Pseudomonadota bacterium]|nr:hypothetical protein [Pseudomonadota bacterium]